MNLGAPSIRLLLPGEWVGNHEPHSARNASVGFTEAARRAGK
jgi:hypothetical protein